MWGISVIISVVFSRYVYPCVLFPLLDNDFSVNITTWYTENVADVDKNGLKSSV